MKKLFVLISSLIIGFNSFANNPVKIDEQLLQSFAIQFPHAQKVVWQESDEAFTVSFIEDGIRVRIVYLRNGSITHFLRYYLEESLPLHIRLSIKDKYPGKSIYGIVEENILSNLENRTKTTYYIKLQDDTGWYTVKAEKNKKLKTIERLTKNI